MSWKIIAFKLWANLWLNGAKPRGPDETFLWGTLDRHELIHLMSNAVNI